MQLWELVRNKSLGVIKFWEIKGTIKPVVMINVNYFENKMTQKVYKNIKDDPDYNVFGLVDMFTDTDYKKVDYEFGDK